MATNMTNSESHSCGLTFDLPIYLLQCSDSKLNMLQILPYEVAQSETDQSDILMTSPVHDLIGQPQL